MKKIFFCISFCILGFLSFSQEIGEIREVRLILMDMPYSGGAKQANFMTADSSEFVSFNDMDWLDKHVSLYNFFQTYRDSCRETTLIFSVTMIYIPKQQYNHIRYEGYIPTGEIVNQWVLTSILKEENCR